MDAYSTRTVQVHEKERELARAWERKHGRAPTSRELLYIANDATLQSRRGKDAGPVDWDALAARWDATLGGELAGIAPAVSNARGPGAQPGEHHGGRAPTGPPTREAQARALAKALVLVSAKHPAWTRHDLVKQLALVMPPETRQMNPQAAQELLLGLADEALSGRTGEVVCLEAPQWPPLPASLRRQLDGRSVYTRPGAARYATTAQLTLEDNWSRTRRPKARRGCRATWPRAALAPTRRVLEAELRGRAARHARARRAARAAAGPGRRRLARPDLGPNRRDRDRPSRDRENLGPGHRRVSMGRAGVRHRHLPERHQRTTRRRSPGRREHHPAPHRPHRGPGPARLADPGRRRLHDLHDPPGRAHRVRGPEQLQAGARRGPGAARRRRRRRSHDTARGPARLRPARRAGPVHSRVGTRRLAAAARRGCHRAG